jgi:hypothetical protein
MVSNSCKSLKKIAGNYRKKLGHEIKIRYLKNVNMILKIIKLKNEFRLTWKQFERSRLGDIQWALPH